MLVDLGRNDIGRVSQPGSVEVSELMDVERYSHVMHLVTHVQGKLKKVMTAFDALRACFPAGTVSGAPKIRAMEIIAELEPDKRGPYAGAVGYFSLLRQHGHGHSDTDDGDEGRHRLCAGGRAASSTTAYRSGVPGDV